MNCYRVSKYDPKFRINGIYTKEEWTDFSDIGKEYNNQIFTEEEYQKIESRYISVVTKVFKYRKWDYLTIDHLEIYEHSLSWRNKQSVNTNNLSNLLQDCLRNRCWCRLINGQEYVHFGWDFYIYIGCEISIQTMKSICDEEFLFCESIESSPYDISAHYGKWS